MHHLAGKPSWNRGLKTSPYARAKMRVNMLVKKGYEKNEAIIKACKEFGVDYSIYLNSYGNAL